MTIRYKKVWREKRQTLHRLKLKPNRLLFNSRIRLIANAVTIVALIAVTVFLWEVGHTPQINRSTGQEVEQQVNRNQSQFRLAQTSDHASSVWSVAISTDGKTLVSGGDDQTLKIWDAETGQLQRTFSAQAGAIRSISLSSTQPLLAAAHRNGTISLWNLQTGSQIRTFAGHQGNVWSVAISPDGRTLASGGGDHTIRLWDLQTGELIHTLSGHGDTVFAVAFSPNGYTLASASQDQTIRLWNIHTGTELRTIWGHTGAVRAIAFAPNGKQLASASWDRTVRLWDVRTGAELHTFSKHTDRVVSVAFNTAGDRLVSGSIDQTIKVWDIKNSTLLYSLTGHSDWVLSVAIHAVQPMIVSGSKDKTLKIWRPTQLQQLAAPTSSNSQVAVTVLDRQGNPTQRITDGNLIALKVRTKATNRPIPVVFELATTGQKIGGCTIPQSRPTCETELFSTLGWYWTGGQPQPNPQIRVKSVTTSETESSPNSFTASTAIRVVPRPTVLVHGFLSSASGAWSAYAGPTGFLQSIGLSGYAVGDGQAAGKLNTGDPATPTKPTNTIAENAEVLKQYIAGVKQQTGAEQVDLIAHSMGGLISRYYIDRLMPERDVAQLIMLASPHGGSDCANLPAALGYYLPATLELRPTYLRRIFNQQITHRHGVPFYLFAGNPIVENFKAPCTDVPSDLFVGRSSVATIEPPLRELPYLHTNMNRSEQIFQEFVEPLLKRQIGEFPVEPDPALPADATGLTQFTRVFTGHVAARGRKEVTIHLNQVTIASFSLFDPTRSLEVIVRGASGKVIPLSADKHGYIVVNDPSSLIYMGYGFNNPKPGPWKITLLATDKTPSKGADYAISAKVVGDAELHTQTNQLSPQRNQPITISAHLDLAGQPLSEAEIQATIRQPNGSAETLSLTGSAEKQTVWQPTQPGTYGVDVIARGFTPNGTPIERTAFLAFEVQPSPQKGWWSLMAVLTFVTISFFVGVRQIGKRGRKRGGR